MRNAGPARNGANLREKATTASRATCWRATSGQASLLLNASFVELTGLTLGAIRELVPRLEAEGLIKTVPQRGMQVAHVDLNLIRDASSSACSWKGGHCHLHDPGK
jgi:hypothetical protein